MREPKNPKLRYRLLVLGLLGIAAACALFQFEPAQDAAAIACPAATLLAQSPALQAEAASLGLSDVQPLVDLVCSSTELLAALDAATERCALGGDQAECTDPGVAIVARLRGER